MTDYINNPVYQELIDESDYDSVKNDERTCLDLSASAGYTTEAEKLEIHDSKINLAIQLQKVAAHKLKLRIWAYSLGEYLYVLSRQGLTLRHKTYTGRWWLFRMKKQSVRRGIWYIGSKRKRRRQKGGAFPIVALATPILSSIGSITIKKLFGGKRKRRRCRRHG